MISSIAHLKFYTFFVVTTIFGILQILEHMCREQNYYRVTSDPRQDVSIHVTKNNTNITRRAFIFPRGSSKKKKLTNRNINNEWYFDSSWIKWTPILVRSDESEGTWSSPSKDWTQKFPRTEIRGDSLSLLNWEYTDPCEFS